MGSYWDFNPSSQLTYLAKSLLAFHLLIRFSLTQFKRDKLNLSSKDNRPTVSSASDQEKTLAKI